QLLVDFPEQLLTLGDDCARRLRFMRSRPRTDQLERLLEVPDLPLGLLVVPAEMLLQLVPLGAPLELSQHRQHLPLRTERHPEPVLDRFFRIAALRHFASPLGRIPSVASAPRAPATQPPAEKASFDVNGLEMTAATGIRFAGLAAEARGVRGVRTPI